MSVTSNDSASPRNPTLWEALVPIVALIGILAVNIFGFKADYQHIPLILAAAVAAGMGWRLGYRWSDMENGMVESINIGMKAILILLVVGILIGTWIAAGIVPLLIHWGLLILNPGFFLVACCLICVVVSLATGSSWTTAGTVGVALIGVGTALQVPLPMTAGAIISGAYFGDKMSPLSDTTNLAPAVAGSELFEHIRHMLYTTVPALVIALVIYGILGSKAGATASSDTIAEFSSALAEHYKLSPVLILAPLAVFIMVILRVPALPALFTGAMLGGLFAIFVQGSTTAEIFIVSIDGFVAETGHTDVDKLLSRGGMFGMMPTIALIFCALGFGGIMEKTKQLGTLAEAIMSFARSTGSLIASTVATCIGVNCLAPEQYLSIVLPGRMYGAAYEKRGLHPKNLSRTLEDAGTMTSPLIPWNSCGAYMFGALTVSPLAYAPYAFVNLLSPVIAIALGYAGWGIAKTVIAPTSEAPSEQAL
ncbi:MAG: Na+/H+ antiporter NhaC [Verrucomicrobiia bacterium]|jgi:NhaC family Na+:H+ antiporter